MILSIYSYEYSKHDNDNDNEDDDDDNDDDDNDGDDGNDDDDDKGDDSDDNDNDNDDDDDDDDTKHDSKIQCKGSSNRNSIGLKIKDRNVFSSCTMHRVCLRNSAGPKEGTITMFFNFAPGFHPPGRRQ